MDKDKSIDFSSLSQDELNAMQNRITEEKKDREIAQFFKEMKVLAQQFLEKEETHEMAERLSALTDRAMSMPFGLRY